MTQLPIAAVLGLTLVLTLTPGPAGIDTMQLVERGQIQLDAQVHQYVPWFHLADAQTSSRITVRDLLYQTSGIPSVTGSEICGFRTSEEAVRIAPGVLDLAQGGQPKPPAPYGPGLWLIVPVVAAGLVLQVALAARWIAVALRGHRRGARFRPVRRPLLSALLSLAWAAVVLGMLLLVASAASATVPALLARVPDLGYVSLASVAFGVAWSAVRAGTVLIGRATALP